MDWRRARTLASGILIVGALVAGAVVGNVLLLGSADHSGDPVGHLSARLAGQSAAPGVGLAPAATARPATIDPEPRATSPGRPADPGTTEPAHERREPDD